MTLLTLLRSTRFFPLLVTQFLGAFNDNLFKTALLTWVALHLTRQSGVWANIIAGLFVLPFFVFSALGAQVADKYARDRIARLLKLTELVLMVGVFISWWINSFALSVLLLLGMGIQSAFFGPIKYALLPQLLRRDELIAGNACVEGTSYIAIVLGLVLGALLPMEGTISVLILSAIEGYVAACHIPVAAPPNPQSSIWPNLLRAPVQTFLTAYHQPVVFRCILGATWFWTIGAFSVVQVYPMVSQILNGTAGVIAFFLILFSVGIALGTLSCQMLLKGLIQATYIPISALGMGICFFVLCGMLVNYPTPTEVMTLQAFWHAPRSVGLSLTLCLLAFCGGLYIVPLNAMMQHKTTGKKLASVIAVNNMMNALGMVVSALFAAGLLAVGVSLPLVFLLVGILSLTVAVYIVSILPDELTRSVVQNLLRFFFRVDVQGLTFFYQAGRRTVIVANHVSLLDGLLIAAFCPEKMTFAIHTTWMNKAYVRWLSHVVDLYPIDPHNPMAIRALINVVRQNRRVMIFPEGRITVTGGLMKIYEGAGVIADKAGASLLPLRISGPERSFFSYLKGQMKRQFFPNITLTFLPSEKIDIPVAIKGRSRRVALARQLYDMMTRMMYDTAKKDVNVFVGLLEAVQIKGRSHLIAEDMDRRPQTYRRLLLKIALLGAAFQKAFPREERIGLMLPNMLAGVVSFFALISVDKVPVMLNFSQGVSPLMSSIRTVGLKTLLTSRGFVEQAHLEDRITAMEKTGVDIVYLEDVVETVSWLTKAHGLWRYVWRIKPQKAASDTAVVLFTSGSEGLPKAVFLSHRNLASNRHQVSSVLSFNATDILMNALPMFHAFGLSVGTILPLLSGVRTFFYPSPLHYRVIPELCYDIHATAICGTDTFLYGYARMANPYDLYRVRYAIAGGEKLKERTALLWMHKFGIRILEGYGVTEASPVIALNTPMYYKAGSVGRFLPRIETRWQPLKGVTEGKRLLIRGDNIMQGYMLPEHPLVLVPPSEGWYDTGDIATQDEAGFVRLLGRARRFAKIGGEMVSLAAVEQAIEAIYPTAIMGVLVIPDDYKGEQLVLMINESTASLSDIRHAFKKRGLSELWMPKHLIYQKQLPLSGSGKLDYMKATHVISELMTGSSGKTSPQRCLKKRTNKK